MKHLFFIVICIACIQILTLSQVVRQPRQLHGKHELGRPTGVINRVQNNEIDVDDEDDEIEIDEANSAKAGQLCPVSLSSSFDMIRAINNYRLTHGLSSINISRSLMSTACAHMRDVSSKPQSINSQCGLHSWTSCCYPSDHSNPNCMHRKALQITTSLRWNLYNVPAYELAYEWAGDPFSSVRAIDMFASNADHRSFILQQGSWSDHKWRSIGAAVSDKYVYIWFGTLVDPNGDFDQFHVDEHVMELPGCTCIGSPITWSPPPTLSLEQQAAAERQQKLQTVPMLFSIKHEMEVDSVADSVSGSNINRMNNVSDVNTTNSETNSTTMVPIHSDIEVNSSFPNTTAESVSSFEIGIETGNTTNIDEQSKTSNATKDQEELTKPMNGSIKTSSQPTHNSSNRTESALGISLADFLKGLTMPV